MTCGSGPNRPLLFFSTSWATSWPGSPVTTTRRPSWLAMRMAASDQRGDVVVAAQQGLAVDLVPDHRQHHGVPRGHRGVPPDALQRVGVGEAARAVRGEQDVDGLDDVVDGPAGVGPDAGAGEEVGI